VELSESAYSEEERKDRKLKQMRVTFLVWALGIAAGVAADVLHAMGFNVWVACLPGVPICWVAYWVSLKYLRWR